MNATASPTVPTLDVRIDHRVAGGFHLQVDTSIPLAGVTAIFGPSGSGKTTLLDCIAGLRADLGGARIRCAQDDWQTHGHREPAWRRRIAYVFQDARLLPHLDVAGNLAFALRRSAPGGVGRSRVIEWLGLEGLLARNPDSLSAGEQQRVAIGRAILRNPRLLLLDEPLVNLDAAAADECLRCLLLLQRESGLPMLYVSHRIEEVQTIADRAVILEGGRNVDEGSILEMSARLDTRLADDESAAAILPVEAGAVDAAYGLRELRIAGQALWVSDDGTNDAHRRLRIPARDVSVCREAPRATSILNVLQTTLVDWRDVAATHCLLRLRLGEHHLLSRITRKSFDQLALTPGDTLYAQVKSTALAGERSR